MRSLWKKIMPKISRLGHVLGTKTRLMEMKITNLPRAEFKDTFF